MPTKATVKLSQILTDKSKGNLHEDKMQTSHINIGRLESNDRSLWDNYTVCNLIVQPIYLH